MNVSEIVEHWIQQIEAIQAGDFVLIPDFAAFPSRARTESLYWCRLFLSPAANPHAATPRPLVPNRHSLHVADRINLDLLRHDHRVGDESLTIFEGVNFLAVRLPAGTGRVWNRESIDAAVRLTLNLADAQHTWVFQYPASIADGTLISTAPDVDPSMMPSWTQRADALVRQGQLYIFCYKRYPQNMGFFHDAQWFEGPVRTGRP